jgi:hypothetical protein
LQIKENIAPISLFGRREGEIPNKIGKKCTLGLKQGLKLISTKFDANLGFNPFFFSLITIFDIKLEESDQPSPILCLEIKSPTKALRTNESFCADDLTNSKSGMHSVRS